MTRYIIIFMIFMVSLLAREEQFATKTCPAFNNMKHSKNTDDVKLEMNRKYTILRYHKGQALILLKGEQPAQRWVDESCFSSALNSLSSVDAAIAKLDKEMTTSNDTKKYDNKNISKHNLLALSWHNAFCETHRKKRECKRELTSLFRSKQSESHFILHGLWPQPKARAYCGVDRKYITMDKYRHWNKLPNLGLTSRTKERLTEIMPGVHSNLHKHEWYKHGTCYGKNAEEYYRDTIALVEQFHTSSISDFFKRNIGKRVTLKQVRDKFDNSFGRGTGKKVELRCRNGLITELWLHLGGQSDDLGTLLQRGKDIRSSCQRGLIDRAGYGR